MGLFALRDECADLEPLWRWLFYPAQLFPVQRCFDGFDHGCRAFFSADGVVGIEFYPLPLALGDCDDGRIGVSLAEELRHFCQVFAAMGYEITSASNGCFNERKASFRESARVTV